MMMNSEIDEHYPCFGCYCKKEPAVRCTIEDEKLQYECPCGTCLVKVRCEDNLCQVLEDFIDKQFPKECITLKIDRKKIFKRLLKFVIITHEDGSHEVECL
jgi:hypothetical protein